MKNINEIKKNEILCRELSDDELNVISGGSKCGCGLYGQGNASEGEFKCWCFMGGNGDAENGRSRCVCAVAGAGGHDPIL